MPSSLFLNPTPETSSMALHLCSFLALRRLLCSSLMYELLLFLSRPFSLASCPHFPPSASLISDSSPSLQDSWFSKCLMISDSCPPPLPFPTESNISDVPWWIFFLDPKKSQEWLKKIPNFEPLRFRQSSYYVWRILVKLGVVAVFTVSCITLKGWTFDSDRWWTCAFDSYSGYKPYIVTGFHLWIMLTFCLLFNEPTLNIFFKFCLPLFRIKILI